MCLSWCRPIFSSLVQTEIPPLTPFPSRVESDTPSFSSFSPPLFLCSHFPVFELSAFFVAFFFTTPAGGGDFLSSQPVVPGEVPSVFPLCFFRMSLRTGRYFCNERPLQAIPFFSRSVGIELNFPVLMASRVPIYPSTLLSPTGLATITLPSLAGVFRRPPLPSALSLRGALLAPDLPLFSWFLSVVILFYGLAYCERFFRYVLALYHHLFLNFSDVRSRPLNPPRTSFLVPPVFVPKFLPGSCVFVPSFLGYERLSAELSYSLINPSLPFSLPILPSTAYVVCLGVPHQDLSRTKNYSLLTGTYSGSFTSDLLVFLYLFVFGPSFSLGVFATSPQGFSISRSAALEIHFSLPPLSLTVLYFHG